jgi:hypothetical protein
MARRLNTANGRMDLSNRLMLPTQKVILDLQKALKATLTISQSVEEHWA